MKKIKVKLVVRNAGGFDTRYFIDSIEGALTVGGQSPGQTLNKQEAQMLIDSPAYHVTVSQMLIDSPAYHVTVCYRP